MNGILVGYLTDTVGADFNQIAEDLGTVAARVMSAKRT